MKQLVIPWIVLRKDIIHCGNRIGGQDDSKKLCTVQLQII